MENQPSQAVRRTNNEQDFGEGNIWRILLKMSPPVMLAQLILAMYNIVDSYFIGKYSGAGLTALSVIFPVQLIVCALAIGTGVGVNTNMARLFGLGRNDDAKKSAGTGFFLAIVSWAVFALLSLVIIKPYVAISATSQEVINYSITYGTIVCVGSLGIFLESIWTKIHQASGNMKLPMIAQIVGALTNIILDPILIFGLGPFPEMGIAGAAYATITGQVVAAIIVGIKGYVKPPKFKEMLGHIKHIYLLGYPSIFMQSLYTVYIMALNIILSTFTEDAVTVLGLYYKLQSFFFIPLMGLQTCIVPLLSFNYARGSYNRCKDVLKNATIMSTVFMVIGVICFEFFPKDLIGIFSSSKSVLDIGQIAFNIIGISFIPAVIAQTLPIFFQAIGNARASVMLSITRQLLCLIPLFWAFSRLGLNYSWLAFPVSEVITVIVGTWLYLKQLKSWKI